MEEVLIIGANSTGLILAHELLKGNVPFRIIDPRSSLTSFSFPVVIDPLSASLLERAGLLSLFQQEDFVALKGMSFNAQNTSIDIDFNKYLTEDPFLSIPLNLFEDKLLRSLESLGCHIEWNTRLVTLIEHKVMLEDTSQILENDIGLRTVCDPKHVIICEGDNYDSLMDTLGISGRISKKAQFSLYSPWHLQKQLKENYLHLYGIGKYVYSLRPLSDGSYVVIGNNNKMFFKEFETCLDEFLENNQPTFCTPKIYKIPLKKQHLFFVGRAIRNFYAFNTSCMGLNIREVFNISWKLIFSAHGASSLLMESYEKEMGGLAKNELSKQRRLHSFFTNFCFVWPGAFILFLKFVRWSSWIKKVLCRRTLLPSLSYEKSPIIKEHISEKEWPGPRPGTYAPMVKTTDKVLPFSYLKAERHLLIFFQDRPQLIAALKEEYGDWTDIVVIEDPAFCTLYHGSASAVYLIRPDGYISYRSSHFKLKELVSYFLRVFPSKSNDLVKSLS